jgi:hypothetical protein
MVSTISEVEDKKCVGCKFFKRRILPPDDLGICTKAEDFTRVRWVYENHCRCKEYWQPKDGEGKHSPLSDMVLETMKQSRELNKED